MESSLHCRSLTNAVLAFIFLMLYFFPPFCIDEDNRRIRGFLINTWLALFNMIPIWNLDGKKDLGIGTRLYIADGHSRCCLLYVHRRDTWYQFLVEFRFKKPKILNISALPDLTKKVMS